MYTSTTASVRAHKSDPLHLDTSHDTVLQIIEKLYHKSF